MTLEHIDARPVLPPEGRHGLGLWGVGPAVSGWNVRVRAHLPMPRVKSQSGPCSSATFLQEVGAVLPGSFPQNTKKTRHTMTPGIRDIHLWRSNEEQEAATPPPRQGRYARILRRASPARGARGSKLYIIGYLTIRQAHAITSLCPWPPPGFQHLWANAHFRRNEGDENLVVAEGDPATSRLP